MPGGGLLAALAPSSISLWSGLSFHMSLCGQTGFGFLFVLLPMLLLVFSLLLLGIEFVGISVSVSRTTLGAFGLFVLFFFQLPALVFVMYRLLTLVACWFGVVSGFTCSS